jgi:hypothetical protein
MNDPVIPQATPLPVGPGRTQVQIAEHRAGAVGGIWAVLVIVLCIAAGLVLGFSPEPAPYFIAAPAVVLLIVLSSLVIIAPGQARVVQFFGRYVGTVRRTGLSWVMPLTIRQRVSVRVRNFETNRLKVNDADGNPVEIAAIVVWQVSDTARAVFAVDDYRNFVTVQAESALRHVAGSHPYDTTAEDGTSLRGSTDVIAQELAQEVAARLTLAGIEVVEVRISHLAYAAEIAQAMLRRQQAAAVVAARARIVEGAVGMVELALDRLESGGVVDLDPERKAAMVSNLMVVLCGDQPAAPIVNTGTLHH